MGTILHFETAERDPARNRPSSDAPCEIVIFPGVRIERHDIDLSHRLRDSAGDPGYGGLDGSGRPRKTS